VALLEENAEKAAQEAKRKNAQSDPGSARRLEAAEAEPAAAAGQKDKTEEKKEEKKEPEVVKEIVP
jgi:hypothetical protein